MRRRGWLIVVLAALTVCGALPGASGARSLSGYEPPAVSPSDSGALADVRPIEFGDEIDLPEVVDSDGGLRITLERCHQRAPYRWRWTGTVQLPEGVDRAEVVLSLAVGLGDVGRSFPVRATVVASGPFAIDETSPARYDGTDGDPRVHEFGVQETDERSDCRIDVPHSNVSTQYFGGYVEPTIGTGAIRWEAPPDSIQAVGSGVRLDRTNDRRRAWANHAWADEPLPLPVIWAPPLSVMRVSHIGGSYREDEPCVTTGLSGRSEFVQQRLHCSRREYPVEGPSAVDGFDVVATPYPDSGAILIGRRGPYDVVVGATTQRRAERLASSLRRWRNLRYEPPTFGPEVTQSLDERVALELAELGLEERARFRDGAGRWSGYAQGVVDASVFQPRVSQQYLIYAYGGFAFERVHGSWVGGAGVSQGGAEGCARTDIGWSGEEGGRISIVTAEPDWTIQVRDVTGTVTTLDAPDGVYRSTFESEDGPLPDEWRGLRLRYLDARGRVVRCTPLQEPSFGEWLNPTEQWSSWTPQSARDRLPVRVVGGRDVEVGERITVRGRGYQADLPVGLELCEGRRSPWYGSARCVPLGYDKSNGRGAFLAHVVVRTRLDDQGQIFEVDCAANPCHLVARSYGGVTRSGSARVTLIG